MSKNVSDVLSASMEKVRQMVDANTVVGTPINVNETTTLIPISKISFALASGGTDLAAKVAGQAGTFGGGAGCGVKVTPVAFILVQGERVRVLPVDEPASSTVERMIEQIPALVDKISDLISGKKADISEI